VAGTLASTSAGTVKLLAPGGATHKNTAVELVGRSTPAPAMNTDADGSPPVHVTVNPLDRVIGAI